MPRTVRDVPANQFIEAYAKHLKEKGQYKEPEWAIFVKTGIARQFSPENNDWFFFRGAAILRRLYCTGPLGHSDL